MDFVARPPTPFLATDFFFPPLTLFLKCTLFFFGFDPAFFFPLATPARLDPAFFLLADPARLLLPPLRFDDPALFLGTAVFLATDFLRLRRRRR